MGCSAVLAFWATPGQLQDNFCDGERDRKDEGLCHFGVLDNSRTTSGQHCGGGPINFDCGTANQLIFNTSGQLLDNSWTTSGQLYDNNSQLTLWTTLGQLLDNFWTPSVIGRGSLILTHLARRCYLEQKGLWTGFPMSHMMVHLCGRHSQVGSLAGAVHLLNDNAGVLRGAQ